MNPINRRDFVKKSALMISALILSGGFLTFASGSAEAKGKIKDTPLPPGATEVTTADAVASAIGYNPDAATVTKKENPTYKAGQNCSSCALYTKFNDGWGKCQMIQVGLVRSGGWCRSYNKKA
jgi:hypothetical protein